MSKSSEYITHFEKSARKVALEKSIYLVICILGAALFTVPILVVDELPTLALFGLVLGAVVAIVLAGVTFREISRIVRSGESWQVTVSDEALTWDAPVKEEMKSFSVAMSDILAVQEHVTGFRNSKRTPKTDFKIRLRSGKTIHLDKQRSGISPRKVFLELEARGVTFEQTDAWQGAKFKIGASE